MTASETRLRSALATNPTGHTRPPLPNFESPPVAEVALSLQFDALNNLRTPHIGFLWSRYRSKFPQVEEHPPLPNVVEWFGLPSAGVPNAQVELLNVPPLARCWFVSSSGRELVQVQQDHFVFNWRKIQESDDYPRYEHIRDGFRENLAVFEDLLKKEAIGDLVPNQCEVTYVNYLISGEGWEHPGELDKLVTVWQNQYSDPFLKEPEDVRIAMRYLIHDESAEPVGRLHVTVEPRYSIIHKRPVIMITMTARGRPLGTGLEGVISFFDLGRKWIVSGFTSVTTQRMHEIWRRLDNVKRTD